LVFLIYSFKKISDGTAKLDTQINPKNIPPTDTQEFKSQPYKLYHWHIVLILNDALNENDAHI